MATKTAIRSLPQGYALQPGFPPVADYQRLRHVTGLSPKTEAQANAVSRGSYYGCHVIYTAAAAEATTEGTALTPTLVVGMGRIIGDGGWYFHVADMAVSPEHQRLGLGDAIMRHLLEYIRENAAEGEQTVNLFANPPGRKLFERYGFYSPAPQQLGMKIRKGWAGEWNVQDGPGSAEGHGRSR